MTLVGTAICPRSRVVAECRCAVAAPGAVSIRVPHDGQNNAVDAIFEPQLPQNLVCSETDSWFFASIRQPHRPQKLTPGAIAAPHCGHVRTAPPTDRLSVIVFWEPIVASFIFMPTFHGFGLRSAHIPSKFGGNRLHGTSSPAYLVSANRYSINLRKRQVAQQTRYLSTVPRIEKPPR